MSQEQSATIESTLSPEAQQQFDADVEALKAYGEAHKLRHLEGRVNRGLDPAGMLAVSDSRQLAAHIAEKLATSLESAEGFISELHTTGPWMNVEKLKNGGTTPEARLYLRLAATCAEENKTNGLSPSEYISDRARVMQELGVLGGEDQTVAEEQFQKHLKDRVYALADKEVLDVDGEKIVVAGGDPFIGMAAEGFKGGISKTGADEDPNTMYFVGTANIEPATLEKIGMAPVFAEVFDPATQAMKRVEVDSEEGKKGRVVFTDSVQLSQPLGERIGKLKRIAGGFFLAYHDKTLATNLLASELKHRRQVGQG